MTNDTPVRTDRVDGDRIEVLIGRLTLDEKVRLLSGRDFWYTWPEVKIGLGSLVLSDGPAGVRGPLWDERDPSLGLPSGTSLGASWDRDLALRVGAVLADEARRKGVHVVLGPTINLQRSPLAGRHFEALSEDPLLTGDLAAQYVAGMQAGGVAATPKHYVGNDYETERFTSDTRVSDRALRELYLFAFEKAITESHAWALMSSYNKVNGVTMTEHDLLTTPLTTEWGFDGMIVGDWLAVRTIESANSAQALSMPGPGGPWGGALVKAVRDGAVPESAIDDKVRKILVLAARAGQLADFPRADPVPSEEDGIAFVREAAAEGMVLVRNTGILPLDPATVSQLAILGHNAEHARTQGGGSATVLPTHEVSPLDGLAAAFPRTRVVHAAGATVHHGISEIPLDQLTNPVTGERGLRVRLLRDGQDQLVEDRFATTLVWFGDGDSPMERSDLLQIHTTLTPAVGGEIALGIGSPGTSRIWVDGELLFDQHIAPVGDMLGASMITPPSASIAVQVQAGRALDLRIEHDIVQGVDLIGMLAYYFGFDAREQDPKILIEEAVAAARTADVAVVVVGTNHRVESEGIDRTTLELPGRQDDLVAAVAAVNPRTVVVVNSGAPVEMPWRNDVAAVLVSWFGGQEYGNALADVLTGVREPGGRLPTTWPVQMSDVPVLDCTPHNGQVTYDEDIHVGYRAWLKHKIAPAYPFGHGLGYTTWAIDAVDATADATHDSYLVSATVTNTGDRPGKHVVQVYASRADTTIDRPVRWLVGYTVVRANQRQTVPVTITVPRRAFAHWDGAWTHEAGIFTLHVASSVVDETARATISVPPDDASEPAVTN